MREILFRGKRMDNGKWVVGYYGEFHNRPTLQEENSCQIFEPKEDAFLFGSCIGGLWHIVERKTVGQFTGLTDKNGKKIFEGDILTIARKMDGIGTYYVPTLACPVNVEVKWDFCGWMWETLCEDKRYLHFPEAWCYFECEVIGNIHDNPELFEV